MSRKPTSDLAADINRLKEILARIVEIAERAEDRSRDSERR